MIHLGFFCAYEDDRTGAIAAAAKASYAKLSAGEQTFFHEVLPPLLMATGIGILNELTFEVFARRWAVISYCHCIELAQYQLKCENRDNAKADGVNAKLDDFAVGKLTEFAIQEAVVRFLTKFDGVVSNVALETDTQFRARTCDRVKFGKAQAAAASQLARQRRKAIV